MTLLIGLGNPGKKYEKTRHNAGFMILDEFAEENHFPDFKLSKKFPALISESNLNGEKIILAKPQTFMNESGKATKTIIDNYKFPADDILVVHDDLDLPLGKIKVAKNRGAAGHKGVASIIKSLKTKNFVRFRAGIKGEEFKTNYAEDFVLGKFTAEENKIFKEIIKKSVLAIEMYLKEGLEKTMSEYNK